MIALLCLLFFLSGVSALLFETLWFRLAGVTFGNSVWASSIVLTSFMGGLALGNALAARFGKRIGRPLVVYARLEIAIGVTGVLLVLALPQLSERLVPLFRPVLDEPWRINPLRLLVGFLLMIVPTTAMGMTLPLLVKVLFARDGNFGRVLGRLYGWNTLGAVAGALAGEVALIGWLGLRGTGYVAGGLNLVAAAAAMALAQRTPFDTPETETARTRLSSRGRRLLLGSFMAGGILLALEVVWFRFLQLFVIGTSLTFAILLATVLAGIGLGGLAGSWWLRRRPGAHRHLVAVALAGGIAVLVAYATFSAPASALAGRWENAGAIARLALWLMFPVSFLSGVLFTLFGQAAQQEIELETRTAGLVTLANTLGAMLGAFVGGFLLLPVLGVERSFFLLGLAYAAVVVCCLEPQQWRRPALHANGLLAAAHLLLLIGFPFGAMRQHLEGASRPYRERFDARTVAVREGLTETVQYLQRDFLGRPLNHRLMTNAYSMSGNSLDSRRYMKYFVHWPVALHPAPRRALLIGFGAGSTAKALTDTRSLEEIHVVDISPDILELSEVVFPDAGTNPLDDVRVRTHVEDGRYFLQTTTQRFDLITAEPPPPVVGGAVWLYTTEYFRLIRDRLSEGGFVTYWLPVTQTTVATTKSMLRAFCDAFDDCSLWAGSKFDWVMIGSRGATGPAGEAQFAAQWRDPLVAPDLAALGLEHPAQLGATFIADAEQLAALVGDALPVVDDWPKRLALDPAEREDRLEYRAWMDPARTGPRFAESVWIAGLWPPAVRRLTASYFRYQPVANMQVFPDDPNALGILDELLGARLNTAALWMMGSSVDHQRIALAVGGDSEATNHYLGAAAVIEGRFDDAASHFARPPQKWPALADALRVYSLCKAGRSEEAQRLAAGLSRPPGYNCW